MELQEYTQPRVNRLSKLSFPETNGDTGLRVHWIRWIAFENSANVSRQKHKHSFYEAHFVLSGINGYTVNGEGDIKLSEGDGIIIFPEVAHRVTELSNDLTKFSVTFTFSEEKNFFSKSERKSSVFFKLNAEILTELNAILKEADKLDGFSHTIIRNRIFNVLCVIARLEPQNAVTEATEPSKTTDIRVASAKQYIEDNVNLFLTCEDVARYCHFNTKYLNRIFKAQTGQTLLEYIHSVKQREAERLLRETTLTLPEIAHSLGFSNEYYFNSFFKRVSTISPGAYRKTVGNKSLPK